MLRTAQAPNPPAPLILLPRRRRRRPRVLLPRWRRSRPSLPPPRASSAAPWRASPTSASVRSAADPASVPRPPRVRRWDRRRLPLGLPPQRYGAPPPPPPPAATSPAGSQTAQNHASMASYPAPTPPATNTQPRAASWRTTGAARTGRAGRPCGTPRGVAALGPATAWRWPRALAACRRHGLLWAFFVIDPQWFFALSCPTRSPPPLPFSAATPRRRSPCSAMVGAASPSRLRSESYPQCQMYNGFSSPLLLSSSKYLGLPLHLKRTRRADEQMLIDKICARLSGWKGCLLTKSGRLQLVQSVLSSIPTYFMSVFSLSNWAIKRIDKIRRSFLWKGSDNTKGGRCLVNWRRVCRPKKLSGLSIWSSAFKMAFVQVERCK
ncbi:hypothetical protein U9M48_037825 [Paspalum notatum var. saurae]|uniref:Uncharacterized protein n=1 Tax=Paspalum notatum var. saurae TaxID=547442 RepID=A0AAQ3UM33_PASNO